MFHRALSAFQTTTPVLQYTFPLASAHSSSIAYISYHFHGEKTTLWLSKHHRIIRMSQADERHHAEKAAGTSTPSLPNELWLVIFGDANLSFRDVFVCVFEPRNMILRCSAHVVSSRASGVRASVPCYLSNLSHNNCWSTRSMSPCLSAYAETSVVWCKHIDRR